MSKKGYCHLTVVLDRSAGFRNLAPWIIQGFNSFVKSQAGCGEMSLSLCLFDNQLDFLVKGVPIEEMGQLTPQNYQPRNQSALFDAIGTAIDNTEDLPALLLEETRPEKIVFVIISDGLDTSSDHYPKNALADTINDKWGNESWEFLFLCTQSSLPTKDIAESLSLDEDSILRFFPTEPGVLLMTASLGRVVKDFRQAAIERCVFTPEDRTKQEELAPN